MPRIKSTLDTYALGQQSITMALPSHSVGDLLVCIFGKRDSVGGSWTTATSGWSTPVTMTGDGSGTGTCKQGYSYKVAALSPEPNPTFTTTDYDELLGVAMCFDGVHATPIDASAIQPPLFNFGKTTLAITTGYDYSLLLQSILMPSPNILRYALMQILPEYEYQQVSVMYTSLNLSVFAKQINTAGAVTQRAWKRLAGEPTGFTSMALAIRDDGIGKRQAYPDALTDITVLDFMSSVTAADNADGNTFIATGGSLLPITPINARPCYGDVLSLLLNQQTNYYDAAVHTTPARNTASNQGFYLDFGTNKDLSTGLIIGSIKAPKPNDILGVGGLVDEGLIFSVGDGTNKHKSWIIMASDSIDVLPVDRNYYIIQPSQVDDTTLDSTSPNLSSIAGLQWCTRSLGISTGNTTFYMGTLLHVKKLVAAGASAQYPMDFAQFARWVCNFYSSPLMLLQGSAACLLLAPVQFGGGDECHVNIDAFAIQFPESSADAAANGRLVCGVHVDEGYFGFKFGCQSGDTMKLTNGIITSKSQWHFEILETASSGATWDFSGLTLVNSIVTLRAVTTFSGMTFADSTIAHNGATVQGCSFNGSLVTTADPSSISDCTMVSGGSGHAITITATGTFTLSGIALSGYGADDSTDAAIYNNSGGAVTINVSGGGSTPTVRNGAGASTTVVSGATLTITGIVAGSDVVILEAGTTTVIETGDAISGTAYAYSYATTQTIDIGVLKAGYVPFYIRNYTLSSSDASLPVAQMADRNYA